jgi:hypothetical protein
MFWARKYTLECYFFFIDRNVILFSCSAMEACNECRGMEGLYDLPAIREFEAPASAPCSPSLFIDMPNELK